MAFSGRWLEWMAPAHRRWRRAALVAASLLGLYALLGFLIVPPIARPWVEKQAASWLGRRVALERLRLNPFALSASAEGLAITDRDGAPLLRWDRLGINFEAVSSLLRREWVFKDVRLIGAAARLAMAQDGSLNIDDIVASLGAPAAGGEPAGPPPVLRVRRLRLEEASVSFVDRSTGTTFTSTLGPLRLDLRDFTTKSDEDSSYAFRGTTESGEAFSWRGRVGLGPPRSEGDFTLEKIALTKYQPYYGGTVPFDIRSGTADLSSGYRFLWGPADRTVRLEGATATLRDVRLSEHGKDEVAVEVPIAEIQGADLDLLATSLALRRFSTRGGRVLLRQTADGRVNLLDMLLPFYAEPSPAEAAAAPATPAAAAPAPTVVAGEIDFEDYTVDVEDLSQPRPIQVHLDQVQIRVFGADNVLGTTAKGVLDLRWNEGGTIHVDGDVSLVGLNGDFAVSLDGLDVVPAGPYVEPVFDLRVRSGEMSAKGRVKANLIDPQHPEFAFAGDARMDDFLAVDGRRGDECLRWKSLSMTGVDYSLRGDRLRVADLSWLSPAISLILSEDGTNNLDVVLRTPVAPEETGEEAEAGPVPPAAPAQPVPPAAPSGGAEGGDTRVARARIRGGVIRAIDRSMTPPVTLSLKRIDGTLAGLSSRPGAKADLRLSARVDDTAPVTLEGQVDPLGADVFTDLTLRAQGIDLKPLGAYAARYLGYEFDRGRLDLDMKYRLEQRALLGSNEFKADPFLLGGKTDSPDATKLPVRLGLALLRDRHGVVTIDVPIEGSLDDPKFRLGRMILRAFVNVFTKLVASPFTLLARAFGGKEDVDLSVIDFPPGAATLPEESGSRLATLAKGLLDRPGLVVSILGGADPAVDPGALRQARLEELVRQEKWRTLGRREREAVPPASVTIDPGEYPRYLKRALKTFRATRPRGEEEAPPETPAEMEAWILERIELGPDALMSLAAARALAVRDRLTAEGVAADRLAVREDARGEAARVSLELQ